MRPRARPAATAGARGGALASAGEGLVAGLAFGLADWLASGPARFDPGLALLVAASALAGGLLAGLLAGLLRGGPGAALALTLLGALALDAAAFASGELPGGALRWAFLAAALGGGLVAARLAARAWQRFPGPVTAFAALAAVPAADVARHAFPGLSWVPLAACALPPLAALAARRLPRAGVWLACAAWVAAAGATGWRAPAPRSSAPVAGAPLPARDAPDVYLFVVDTLRADETPGLEIGNGLCARLTREGVRFEQAVASAPWTLPSVASLLTGLHPSQHGATDLTRRLRADATTLAERFAAAGWETAAFTGGGFVAPAFGLERGFATFDPDAEYRFRLARLHAPLVWHLVRNRWLPQRWVLARVDAFGGVDELARRVERWLAAREPSRPRFVLVHTYEVHDYYLYDAAVDGPLRDAGGAPFGARLSVHPDALATLDQAGLDWYRALYRARIAHVDRALARLLERLERASARPALVALVADHGEGFDAALGRVHHGGRLHDDLLRVPLLLRAPGLAAGARVREQVRTLDLGPTLLELAGLASMDGVEGRSLAPALAGREPWPAPAWSEERGGQRALRTLRWKVLGAGGARSAFDLAADPLETRPRASGEAGAPAELFEDWDAFPERFPPHAGEERALDAETRARLGAIGYGE